MNVKSKPITAMFSLVFFSASQLFATPAQSVVNPERSTRTKSIQKVIHAATGSSTHTSTETGTATGTSTTTQTQKVPSGSLEKMTQDRAVHSAASSSTNTSTSNHAMSLPIKPAITISQFVLRNSVETDLGFGVTRIRDQKTNKITFRITDEPAIYVDHSSHLVDINIKGTTFMVFKDTIYRLIEPGLKEIRMLDSQGNITQYTRTKRIANNILETTDLFTGQITRTVLKNTEEIKRQEVRDYLEGLWPQIKIIHEKENAIWNQVINQMSPLPISKSQLEEILTQTRSDDLLKRGEWIHAFEYYQRSLSDMARYQEQHKGEIDVRSNYIGIADPPFSVPLESSATGRNTFVIVMNHATLHWKSLMVSALNDENIDVQEIRKMGVDKYFAGDLKAVSQRADNVLKDMLHINAKLQDGWRAAQINLPKTDMEYLESMVTNRNEEYTILEEGLSNWVNSFRKPLGIGELSVQELSIDLNLKLPIPPVSSISYATVKTYFEFVKNTMNEISAFLKKKGTKTLTLNIPKVPLEECQKNKTPIVYQKVEFDFWDGDAYLKKIHQLSPEEAAKLVQEIKAKGRMTYTSESFKEIHSSLAYLEKNLNFAAETILQFINDLKKRIPGKPPAEKK